MAGPPASARDPAPRSGGPRASATELRSGAPKAPATARELVAMAREFLERKGVADARLEAELLTAHALGVDRLRLFLDLERPLQAAEVDRARDLLVRRGRREPTAYVVGAREFYGRPFRVDPRVLVPRPETELVVDRARALLAGRAPGARVLDVGTGSGCLALSIALECLGCEVVALELSRAALDCARENAEALGATSVRFVEGDGIALLGTEAERGGPFDLVVSNPPYVDPAGRGDLEPEVREHEPALALFTPDGDPDHWVRRLVEESRTRLAPQGALLVELGIGQAPRAAALCRERGLEPRFHRDLAGIERVLEVPWAAASFRPRSASRPPERR